MSLLYCFTLFNLLGISSLLTKKKIQTLPETRFQSHRVIHVTIEPFNNDIIEIEADGEYLGVAPAEFKIIEQAVLLAVN